LVMRMETSLTMWVVRLLSSLAGLLTVHVRPRPGSGLAARCPALTAGLPALRAVVGLVASRNARCGRRSAQTGRRRANVGFCKGGAGSSEGRMVQAGLARSAERRPGN
jgi:hypothetical protein